MGCERGGLVRLVAGLELGFAWNRLVSNWTIVVLSG